MKKNTHIKPRRKTFLIGVIVLLTLFMVNFASALDFDNVKQIFTEKSAFTIGGQETSYRDVWKEYPPLKIVNAFGLGATLFEGAITEHTGSCANDCSSTMNVYIPNSGALVDAVRFINLRGRTVEVDYTLYLKTGVIFDDVPVYETICEPHYSIKNQSDYLECGPKQTGTKKVARNTWREYNVGEVINPGMYTLKIEGVKAPLETIDWQIETQGRWLDEWADWGPSTKVEWLETGPEGEYCVYGADEGYAQQFTVGEVGVGGTYLASAISIYADDPHSDVDVWIKGMGADNKPNATIISSVIGLNANDAPPDGSKDWYNISFTTQGEIHDGQIYGFVIMDGGADEIGLCTAFDGGTNNYYTGGNMAYTVSGGDTWIVINNRDLKFRIYGNETASILNTAPNATLIRPANNTKNFTTSHTFNCSVVDDFKVVNASIWIDGVKNYTKIHGTSNSTSLQITRTLTRGVHTWTCDVWDNNTDTSPNRAWAISNWTLTIFTPTLNTTSNSPGNNSIISDTDVNFTTTLIPNGTSLINNTIWVWFENGTFFGKNTTTVTGTASNTTTMSLSNHLIADYKWNSYGCSDYTCEWSKHNLTYSIGANFTDNYYETHVYETNASRFLFNVSLIPGAVLYAAKFNYNGTKYSTTQVDFGGGLYSVESTIDIPLLEKRYTARNRTFKLELEYRGGVIVGKENTTAISHIVKPLLFQICNGTIKGKYVNYTFYNETNISRISGFLDGSWDFWLGSGDHIKNYTLDSVTTLTNRTICSNINGTINVSAKLNLQSNGFNQRTFFFNKERYSNATSNVPLYLQSQGSAIIIEVTDPGLRPLNNYFVKVYRYYPATNTYEIVEHAETDEFGQFSARLIEDEVKYKFAFYNSNNVLQKITGDTSILCRTTYCVIPFVIEDTTDDFQKFENITDFEYTLSYDDATKTFTYTWNDLTGDIITSRLLVQKFSLNGTETICNTSSYAVSSSIDCVVGSNPASYTATAFRKVSGEAEKKVAVLSKRVGDTSSIYGKEGLFWSFILLFTLIAIGSFNPTVGVLLYLLGFIGLGVMGIVSFTIPIFIGMLAIGIIFIWAFRG